MFHKFKKRWSIVISLLCLSGISGRALQGESFTEIAASVVLESGKRLTSAPNDILPFMPHIVGRGSPFGATNNLENFNSFFIFGLMFITNVLPIAALSAYVAGFISSATATSSLQICVMALQTGLNIFITLLNGTASPKNTIKELISLAIPTTLVVLFPVLATYEIKAIMACAFIVLNLILYWFGYDGDRNPVSYIMSASLCLIFPSQIILWKYTGSWFGYLESPISMFHDFGIFLLINVLNGIALTFFILEEHFNRPMIILADDQVQGKIPESTEDLKLLKYNGPTTTVLNKLLGDIKQVRTGNPKQAKVIGAIFKGGYGGGKTKFVTDTSPNRVDLFRDTVNNQIGLSNNQTYIRDAATNDFWIKGAAPIIEQKIYKLSHFKNITKAKNWTNWFAYIYFAVIDASNLVRQIGFYLFSVMFNFLTKLVLTLFDSLQNFKTDGLYQIKRQMKKIFRNDVTLSLDEIDTFPLEEDVIKAILYVLQIDNEYINARFFGTTNHANNPLVRQLSSEVPDFRLINIPFPDEDTMFRIIRAELLKVRESSGKTWANDQVNGTIMGITEADIRSLCRKICTQDFPSEYDTFNSPLIPRTLGKFIGKGIGSKAYSLDSNNPDPINLDECCKERNFIGDKLI